MNTGNVITSIRKKKGITQRSLAESCGISVSYLSKIENNKRFPSTQVWNDIGKMLELPLPILFFLSMDETDVQDDKKSFYQELMPKINELISQMYLE